MPQSMLPTREQHKSIAMATRLCESSECPGGVGRADEGLGGQYDPAASKGRRRHSMTVD